MEWSECHCCCEKRWWCVVVCCVVSRHFNLLLTNVPFQRLAEWVAIKSVSAEPEKRSEVVRMVKFVGAELERLGGRVEYVDVGMQKVRKLLSCLSVCLVSSTLTVPLSHLDRLP